ncbi:MAG: adenylyl-sulfate kinase [Polyangiales bacterium]
MPAEKARPLSRDHTATDAASGTSDATSGTAATNVVWHAGEIERAHREALLGQRGTTLWFTGLSGAGKSSIASRVEAMLVQSGQLAYRLDGDNIRHGLNSDLGFNAPARQENIRRVTEVARLLTDAGLIVLTAFISPYRADRTAARTRFAPGEFFEVFIDAPLALCETRDPKSLYARARRGEIRDFTGISAPYEAPIHPDLHLRTDELDIDAASAQVLRYLQAQGRLSPPNQPTR